MNLLKYYSLIFFFIFLSCSIDNNELSNVKDLDNDNYISFYYGADLSYINEMEDCGAIYKDLYNNIKDPYKIFAESGTNIVRIRLWHNPTWTNYSNYNDVKKSIIRAKSENMQVLLDFHYSDTWADPSKQQIPDAWLNNIDNTSILGDLLYNYTFDTLEDLANLNLLPNIVQIGNEINSMILQNDNLNSPIDWDRNAMLINKGVKAVRDLSNQENKKIDIMLHIAQPENALWWIEEANNAGLTDFDHVNVCCSIDLWQ